MKAGELTRSIREMFIKMQDARKTMHFLAEETNTASVYWYRVDGVDKQAPYRGTGYCTGMHGMYIMNEWCTDMVWGH